MSYLQCLFCGFLNHRGSSTCTVCHSLLSPRSHVTSVQLLQSVARRRNCHRCRRVLLPIGTCTFCSAVHAFTAVGSPLYSGPTGNDTGEVRWHTRAPAAPQAPLVPVDTFSALIQPVLPMQSALPPPPRALSLMELLAGDVLLETEDVNVGNMTLRFNRISNMLTTLISGNFGPAKRACRSAKRTGWKAASCYFSYNLL